LDIRLLECWNRSFCQFFVIVLENGAVFERQFPGEVFVQGWLRTPVQGGLALQRERGPPVRTRGPTASGENPSTPESGALGRLLRGLQQLDHGLAHGFTDVHVDFSIEMTIGRTRRA
jgi:hypothetical protein